MFLWLTLLPVTKNSNLKDYEHNKREGNNETNVMAKLLILYDGQTGNAERMAETVAEGAV